MATATVLVGVLTLTLTAASSNTQGQNNGRGGGGHLSISVTTENGLVLGMEEHTGQYLTWAWKGIPYAQSPEGTLRWQAPQPPANWAVLNADTFGSHCPQYDGSGGFSGSEDCLYLNVWRPRTQEHNLPVYFYLHGGETPSGPAATR